jgi:hypothetical protein
MMVHQAVNLPHHQEEKKRPLLLAANNVTIKSAGTVNIKQFKTCYDDEERGKLTDGITLLNEVAHRVQDQLNAKQLEVCNIHSDQMMMCENLV